MPPLPLPPPPLPLRPPPPLSPSPHADAYDNGLPEDLLGMVPGARHDQKGRINPKHRVPLLYRAQYAVLLAVTSGEPTPTCGPHRASPSCLCLFRGAVAVPSASMAGVPLAYATLIVFPVPVLVCVSLETTCSRPTNTGKFSVLIMVLILGNTAVLGMEHAGASAEFRHGLVVANYVFTALFTSEMMLKLFALGTRWVARRAWARALCTVSFGSPLLPVWYAVLASVAVLRETVTIIPSPPPPLQSQPLLFLKPCDCAPTNNCDPQGLLRVQVQRV
jgi:hypothetical protein